MNFSLKLRIIILVMGVWVIQSKSFAQTDGTQAHVQSLENCDLLKPVETSDSEECKNKKRWSVHFQTTFVDQANLPFNSAYENPQRSFLSHGASAETLSTTLYLGFKISNNIQVYIDPEMTQGQGLNGGYGIASFPSGEVIRIGDPGFSGTLARAYIVETIPLGKDTEKVEDGPNQLPVERSIERVTLIVGKFAPNDFFDVNQYAHDPRSQFFNWAFMDNLPWDYGADVRNYTYGVFGELNKEKWAIRAAVFTVSSTANGPNFDWHIPTAHNANIEYEYRYKIAGHGGTIRALGFESHTLAYTYQQLIDMLPQQGYFNPPSKRTYHWKYGGGINGEQEITPNLGTFFRYGRNDGKEETWAYADATQSASGGLEYKGTRWNRPDDRIGVAYVASNISPEYQEFLKKGGVDFSLGDGNLSYKPEKILEVYYLTKVFKHVSVTPDFQYVKNPGYNAARGPVKLFGIRVQIRK